MDGETTLQMAVRHVREAEACIERQRGVIERLRDQGLSTDNERVLLKLFQQVQAMRRQALESLLGAGPESALGGPASE